MLRRRTRRTERPSLAIAAGSVVGAAVLLAVWSQIRSWPRSDLLAATAILLGFLFTAVQVVGPSWWERRLDKGPSAPAVTAELLDEWRRALAHRILALRRGQVDRLVVLGHQIEVEAYADTRNVQFQFRHRQLQEHLAGRGVVTDDS